MDRLMLLMRYPSENGLSIDGSIRSRPKLKQLCGKLEIVESIRGRDSNAVAQSYLFGVSHISYGNR